MNIGIIIQARMGSSRLPGKVMKKIDKKTILEHVITRVKQVNSVNDIIIATTTKIQDSIIEETAIGCGVKVYRGSEEDVLARYYHAATKEKLDVIVRITSDCPLIDPKIIDELVNYYINNNYDMVSNVGIEKCSRTYPRGLDTEVFSYKFLEQAFYNATEKRHREHVTLYLYENKEDIFCYKIRSDYSHYRWTLDTEEDWEFIATIYKFLYEGEHDFYMEDILAFINKNPKYLEINSHIEQKKYEVSN